MKEGFKKCPYCGKEIKDIAIKCQYCLKFLNQEPEKTTKKCPFCLNEIDINEKKCPFCDEVLLRKNKVKKFRQFMVDKKISFLFFIVGIILISLFLFVFKGRDKISGDIIGMYDKYGQVQCELFDKEGNFVENIYVKDDKMLMTSSNVINLTGAYFTNGYKEYFWGESNIKFGGYMSCNFSEVTEDINGNDLKIRQRLINLFGDEEDPFYIVKNCKYKVPDDIFNFELPKYCDFENNVSLSGWKEFKYRSLFSFKYPDGLKIQKYSYPYWSNFFDGGNIYVNVYDFENFVKPMLDKNYKNAGILLEMNESGQKEGWYESMLNSISNGNGVKTVNSPDFFDHISMYNTVGPIATHKINVDGVNGLIVNYYFTDDKSKGCISQFVTELLLFKSYDEIISIVFKNNFGEVENALKDNYYDFYETQNGQYCSEKNFWLTNDLEEFYEYGGGTSAYEFKVNYSIIKAIIKTIKFID